MNTFLEKWNLQNLVKDKQLTFQQQRKISFYNDKESSSKISFANYEVDQHDQNQFIAIESNQRLNILKDKLKQLNVYQDHQQNFQVQVSHSTFALTQKKKNLRNKYATNKSVIKLKFLSIANIKSEWVEVDSFSTQNLSKTEVNFELEVLKEAKENLFKVNKNIFNIKPKKPFKMPKFVDGLSMPMNLLEDQFLMNIYEKIEHQEDQFHFFVPNYIFNVLTTVNNKNYPWNIKIMKEKNKYILYSEIKEDNPFLIFQTYDENNTNKLSDDELKVASENQESTFVEESFYRLLSGNKDEQVLYKNYKYVKITLDKNFHIYTKINIEASDSQQQLVLLKTFNTTQSVWSKYNKNPKKCLNECLKNNIARVTSWIIQSVLIGASKLNIGIIVRGQQKKSDSHKIIQVVKKNIFELKNLFNFKETTCFICLITVLNRLLNIKQNGTYILHKEEFKQELDIYRLPHATEDMPELN